MKDPTLITVRCASGTKILNCYGRFVYGAVGSNATEFAIAPDARTGGLTLSVFHAATGMRLCPIDGGHMGVENEELVERARASLYKYMRRYSAPVVYQALREAPILQAA